MSAAPAETARIVVCGAAGRMGRMIVGLVREDPNAELVGAVEAPGHPDLGRDTGEVAGGEALGVELVDDYAALAAPDRVTLEFAPPDVALAHLRIAANAGCAIAIGTTGLTPEQKAEVAELAKKTRTILAPNFSVGVNVLLRLVADAARALGGDFDTEIVEMHHNQKVDAPSGTALALGEAVAAATGRDLGKDAVYGREGQVGRRGASEIGIMTLRGGDTVGDHTVFFAGQGERIELTHRSLHRSCLARGAVRAAVWLSRQPAPGLYTMADVLSL